MNKNTKKKLKEMIVDKLSQMQTDIIEELELSEIFFNEETEEEAEEFFKEFKKIVIETLNK